MTRTIALLTSALMTWLVSDAAARRVTKVFGPEGDGGTPAGLLEPIATDGAGNLYGLSDSSNRVFKITPSGAISTILTAAGDGAANPFDCSGSTCDLLVTAAGVVYVTSNRNDRVFRVDPGGTVTSILDGTGDGMGNTFIEPDGLAMDGDGNVFVAGSFTDNVFKITPGGVVSAVITAAGDGLGHTLANPTGVTVDADDNVFVQGYAGTLFRIAPGGAITAMLDVLGDGVHAFVPSNGVPVVDAAGNVYAVSPSTDVVFKVTPAGVVTPIVDASGDGAGHPLDEPLTVAVGADGNAWVAGVHTNLFRIDGLGIVTFIAAFPAELVFTYADAAGDVYVESFESTKWRVVGDRLRVLFDAHGDGVLDVDPRLLLPAPSVLHVTTFPESLVYRVELLCDPSPRAGCRTTTKPRASMLQVKNLANESRDLVSWKWKGAATDLADFGSPGALDYSLCVYEADTDYASLEISVPAGATCPTGPCWKARGTQGFALSDRGDRAPDGVTKVVLKAGADGRASVALTANRENVPEPFLPLTRFPLRAQLQASNGECWEASYSQIDVTSTGTTKMSAKSD